jgi:hypothetical protein
MTTTQAAMEKGLRLSRKAKPKIARKAAKKVMGGPKFS